MSRLSRWWHAFVALLDTREIGTSLALVRIGVGLSVLWTLHAAWSADVVELIWVDVSEGGYRDLGSGPWLVAAFGGPTADNVWDFVQVTAVSAFLLTLGVGGPVVGRLIALIALQSHMALTGINTHAIGSYDTLISNALWLLVLADSTRTLSVHSRLTYGGWTSEHLVPAWPRYLFIFQLMVVYWTTGLQKLSAYWTPGGDFSALYYILQQPTWARRDWSAVAHWFPITQVGTAVAWLWEVTVPLWLLAFFYRYTADRSGAVRAWFNRWDVRSWYIAIGLLFHLVIHATMNVGPFSWISIAFYPAFYTPAEWARATSRVGGRSPQG